MDPFANNARGWCRAHLNPLHTAVLAGSLERTLAVLARRGGSVDIDQRDVKCRATPLMMAAHVGNLLRM